MSDDASLMNNRVSLMDSLNNTKIDSKCDDQLKSSLYTGVNSYLSNDGSIDSETHLFTNNNNDADYLNEDSTWEFQRDKLKLGRLIDEGAFGRVYMADAYGIIPGRYKTMVAVKMLKDNASKLEFTNFIKELEIMKTVGKHENVISLLGCCTKEAQCMQ